MVQGNSKVATPANNRGKLAFVKMVQGNSKVATPATNRGELAFVKMAILDDVNFEQLFWNIIV